MKNKILIFSFMLIAIFTLSACGKEETKPDDATRFKEEYESLNEVSQNGITYRSVSIDEDNPFIYITAEDLLDKMDEEEAFYVYFGSKLCPWCRSVIEKAIEVAKEKNISKIYYIDIWDEEGNEILRDKYILDSNNQPKQTIKGTDAYYELLKRFDDILNNYTLIDEEGNTIEVGEKRIYAPNFVYIKNGIAKDLVEGMSDKQEGYNSELTDEILADEETIFRNFFEE